MAAPFIFEVVMIYDAILWLCIAYAVAQFLITGDKAPGAVAFLLVLIQIGRVLRNRRQMAF